MTRYREQIAHDLWAGLADGDHERPIDRIRAFSKASRLGTALWRLRADDMSLYGDAVRMLANRAKCKTELTRRACELVLEEWINPRCRHCGGRGEVVGRVRIQCPVCAGSRLHRPVDGERARFLKIPKAEMESLNRVIDRIWDALHDAERSVDRKMWRELK